MSRLTLWQLLTALGIEAKLKEHVKKHKTNTKSTKSMTNS